MRFLLVFSLILTAVIAPFSWANSCKNALDFSMQIAADKAGVVTLTSANVEVKARVYPLQQMLAHLRIDEAMIRDWSQRQLKVASIGESYSPLLPHLLNQGVAAQGVDLWYHTQALPDSFMGRQMKAYQEKYANHLVAASITERLPYEDNSLDVVVMHMLMNNFKDLKMREKIINEISRVLKKDGVAIIADFSGYVFQKEDAAFALNAGNKVLAADVNVVDYDPNIHGAEYGPDLQGRDKIRVAFRYMKFQKKPHDPFQSEKRYGTRPFANIHR